VLGQSGSSKDNSTILGTGQFHIEDLYSQTVLTILSKLDHFFDNPIEEDV